MDLVCLCVWGLVVLWVCLSVLSESVVCWRPIGRRKEEKKEQRGKNRCVYVSAPPLTPSSWTLALRSAVSLSSTVCGTVFKLATDETSAETRASGEEQMELLCFLCQLVRSTLVEAVDHHDGCHLDAGGQAWASQ